MRAAKNKKPKTRTAGSKKTKPKKSALKKAKATKLQNKHAPAAPQNARPFRFTAADVVQILFNGAKKPEGFRVDDMAEATLAAQDGRTSIYFQYRLVGAASERVLWFFDPKPVGGSDPIGPSLWQPASEQSLDGHEPVAACSGNFNTKSITSYDGSGSRHVVKVDDKPTYRMRLDLNGQRAFCQSLAITIGKGDVLKVQAA
jgi:hypothetical protein